MPLPQSISLEILFAKILIYHRAAIMHLHYTNGKRVLPLHIYLGKYEVAELVSHLCNADALLLPYDRSKFSQTIFPAKYFEAMALGLPIISDSKMVHLPLWNDLV